MHPILLRFGQFELRTYGVIVALSFLAGLWLARKEAARKGLDPALMIDFTAYALIGGGILGARLYFIAFSNPLHYLSKPWEIFAVWHGCPMGDHLYRSAFARAFERAASSPGALPRQSRSPFRGNSRRASGRRGADPRVRFRLLNWLRARQYGNR